MPIKDYSNTYPRTEYSTLIRFFASVLARTSSNGTKTQIALHAKIASDYRLYVKKVLNDPASIDASFRRILIERLNKLYAENFFSAHQFSYHLARQIIDDMQENDALLRSEFFTLEDKIDFITLMEDEVKHPISHYRQETLTLRAGDFSEKQLRNKTYTPARAQLSELIGQGTTNQMAQNWVAAVSSYEQALRLLQSSSLYTATDYSKNHADMTVRIAACIFNEGMLNIENKNIEAAIYRLAAAYRKLETIHNSVITSKVKKLKSDYLYMLLRTINSYAVLNPGDFKLFIDSEAIIPATDRKLFPLKLELIRNIVKAAYIEVKNSLAKDDLRMTIYNLHLASDRNNEALDEHHYPQEEKQRAC